MHAESSLRDLGLSKQESQMYLALLASGGLPASAIAKEVGIRRTTAYAILKKLAEQGFVSVYVRKGRQIFAAEKPTQVAGYFEKKLSSFAKAIPFLETLDKKQLQTSGLRFIESLDELKRFYAGILREYRHKSYVIMGNTHTWDKLDPDFFSEFRKDRAAAGIRTKLLLTDDSRNVSPKDGQLLREVRFLPKNYSFKSIFDIFDDKILIVSPDQSSLAIVIAVPAMVDIFRSTFQLIWDVVETKTAR